MLCFLISAAIFSTCLAGRVLRKETVGEAKNIIRIINLIDKNTDAQKEKIQNTITF